MKNNKLNEVLFQLGKKHDVSIQNKEVLVLNGNTKKPQFKPQHDLGNGSWGKIDFLVNHCGYRQFFVAEW